MDRLWLRDYFAGPGHDRRETLEAAAAAACSKLSVARRHDIRRRIGIAAGNGHFRDFR
jgi:hypothetical protein